MTPDLTDAPTIEDWFLYPHRPGAAVLVGTVKGHPRLPDGPVTTSRVTALNEREGWAETVNRIYRLGRPHGARRTWLDEFMAQPGEPVPLPTLEQTKAFLEQMQDEVDAERAAQREEDDDDTPKP
jgi:hypothetical protein